MHSSAILFSSSLAYLMRHVFVGKSCPRSRGKPRDLHSHVFIGDIVLCNLVQCLRRQASCVVFIGFIRVSSLVILSVFINNPRAWPSRAYLHIFIGHIAVCSSAIAGLVHRLHRFHSHIFIGNIIRVLHRQASCMVFAWFIRISSLRVLSYAFISNSVQFFICAPHTWSSSTIRVHSLLGLHSHVFIGKLVQYLYGKPRAWFSRASFLILSCLFISNRAQRLYWPASLRSLYRFHLHVFIASLVRVFIGGPRAWSSSILFTCLDL